MNKKNNQLRGFTLAETLIALIIVGIVATLTIPPLKAAIWDIQQKSLYKKAYNTIINAMDQTQTDLGYLPKCYCQKGSSSITNECKTKFFPAFEAELKYAKKCDSNSYDNGCIPYYIGNGSAQGCDAWGQTDLFNNNPSYVLANGTIVMLYTAYTYPILLVDINGKTPPNKWGYDVFDFRWYGDDGYLKLAPANCFTPETGGRYSSDMLNYVFN